MLVTKASFCADAVMVVAIRRKVRIFLMIPTFLFLQTPDSDPKDFFAWCC